MKSEGTPLYHPVSLNRDYLAGKMLEKFSAVHPKPWSAFSMERRVQVRDAFLDAIRSLEETLATGSPAFLLDHAGWAQARFAALHFPPGFADSFFRVFRDVLRVELPQDYRKAAGTFAGKAVSALKPGTGGKAPRPAARSHLSPAARSLLKSLLAGDRGRATAAIDRALEAGTPVQAIYTGFFLPVLRETGLLWQQDRVTIAQEHYVSSEIRRMMDQLHDRIALAGKKVRRGKKVVASCAGEELHEIGIRMVADFLEMDGWDVYYTGANMPANSILAAVKEQQPDVLVLSITMPSRLPDIWYLIRSLRADRGIGPVKIIVGGTPFSILPDLWKKVGADAVALTAEEATAAANRLTVDSPGRAEAVPFFPAASLPGRS